jgi:hypothetical protein
MSTQPAPTPTQTPSSQAQTIRVVSHTALIYWWPVWLVGFILAALTYVDREGAANKNYGMVYMAVLLVVIFGSNVPLRGLASIIAILAILVLIVLFAYMGWWAPIFDYLGGLHIQISLAGYLVPSVVLLVLWLATFLFYDPMRYMVFTPGQLVVHKEIGDLREVFDTTQVEAEKRRSDLFRHWILGFGAGDLIIKVPSQSLQIELPNVLFVNSRVTEIANLMKLKPVLSQ